MRAHIRFLFCLSFACLSPLHAQKFHTPSDNSIANDRKELGQIETDLLNAYVHRDLSVRDRYVADEFVGVDSSGSIYSKQQDMQDMKDGTFALKSFKEEDSQVRLLGEFRRCHWAKYREIRLQGERRFVHHPICGYLSQARWSVANGLFAGHQCCRWDKGIP